MKRLIIFVMAGVILISVVELSTAQEKLITLSFKEVPLGAALDIFSRKTGRKFITDTRLANKKIVLDLKEVTPEEALNALLDTYDLYYVRQKDTDIYTIKSKTEGRIVTVSKVFSLNYADAVDLVKVINIKLSRGGKVTADERTNSLIVSDMADNIEKIGRLIKELDSPTPQVLLEARIVEMKVNSSLKWGVDVSNIYNTKEFWSDPLSEERYLKLDEERNKESIQPKGGAFSQAFSHGLPASGKFSVAIIHKDYSIQGFIEAMKESADARILSNPKLLVLSNKEATINIVDEIPYQEMTQSEEGNPVVSTEFKEVGIKLKVKPQVNKDDTIILSITPEQSFRTGESLGGVPIIKTSKADTTLMLRDGETAIIGGLIRETESQTEYKVPILGDIPILGFLFKKLDKTKERTELTIFITANIIK